MTLEGQYERRQRRTDPRPGQGRPQRDKRPPSLSTPFDLARRVMPKIPAGPSSQQATRGLDPRNRPAPQQRRMPSPFGSPPAIAPQGPLPQVAPGMPFTPLSPQDLGQGTRPSLSAPFNLAGEMGAKIPAIPPELWDYLFGQGGVPPFSARQKPIGSPMPGFGQTASAPWDYFRNQYEKLPWWANPLSVAPNRR